MLKILIHKHYPCDLDSIKQNQIYEFEFTEQFFTSRNGHHLGVSLIALKIGIFSQWVSATSQFGQSHQPKTDSVYSVSQRAHSNIALTGHDHCTNFQSNFNCS